MVEVVVVMLAFQFRVCICLCDRLPCHHSRGAEAANAALSKRVLEAEDTKRGRKQRTQAEKEKVEALVADESGEPGLARQVREVYDLAEQDYRQTRVDEARAELARATGREEFYTKSAVSFLVNCLTLGGCMVGLLPLYYLNSDWSDCPTVVPSDYAPAYTLTGCSDPAHCGTFRRDPQMTCDCAPVYRLPNRNVVLFRREMSASYYGDIEQQWVVAPSVYRYQCASGQGVHLESGANFELQTEPTHPGYAGWKHCAAQQSQSRRRRSSRRSSGSLRQCESVDIQVVANEG